MSSRALLRLIEWDRALCARCNGASAFAPLRFTCVVASRLGNGVFWYVLMGALLAVGGRAAFRGVAHMFVAGMVGAIVYKLMKHRTCRPRPYAAQAGITLCAIPLDRYSFPSGHTLHATAFTLVALAYFPALGGLLVPFAALVALSRVVLGLHYPSDVAAGALVGAALASLSFLLEPLIA